MGAQDKKRRQAAGVPADNFYKERWELALYASSRYGEAVKFRDALEKRDLHHAIGVAPQSEVWINLNKAQRPVSAKDVALKAKGWKMVRWREGSRDWLE